MGSVGASEEDKRGVSAGGKQLLGTLILTWLLFPPFLYQLSNPSDVGSS